MENQININVGSFLLKFEKSHRYNNKPLTIDIDSSDGNVFWGGRMICESKNKKAILENIQLRIDRLKKELND